MVDEQVEQPKAMTCGRCEAPAEKVVSLIGFTDVRGEGVHTDLCASCLNALQVWLGNPSDSHFVEFKFKIGDPVVVCVGKAGRPKGAVRSCLHSDGPPNYLVRHMAASGLTDVWCTESEIVRDA